MKILIHRPVRTREPVSPSASDRVAAPPQLPESPAGGLPVQMLLPVFGSVSSMVMMMVMRGSNPVFMVVGALVFVVALASGVAMAFTQRAKATKARELGRVRYLDYLEELRSAQSAAAQTVRTSTLETNPDPVLLTQIAADPARVWERRPENPDFLRLRLGSGNVPWFGLIPPAEQNPVQPLDPVMLGEAIRVSQTYSIVEDMPVWCDVSTGGDIVLIGSPAATVNTARALIAQLATFHTPTDVRVAAVLSPDRVEDWSGFSLLPHSHATTTPTGMPRPLIATSVSDLMDMLDPDLTSRIRRVSARRHSAAKEEQQSTAGHLVVFLDEHGTHSQLLPIPEAGYTCADLGITVIHLIDDRLDEPSVLRTRITISGDGSFHLDNVDSPTAPTIFGRVDTMSAALLEALARDLAPLALTTRPSDTGQSVPETMSAMELLGIDHLASVSPHTMWHPRGGRDFLRVPIGLDDHGAPLLLDLKEAAQLGMGPHGICVGATGSGKSELLRTLVLSLALAHSPEDLSMILVDYKGGAAFAPFAPLPHIAGLIDNLADDPQLTRRARASIEGEVLRRQEMLKQANSAASINHYRQMRIHDPSMPPMPHLFLVIDEFGELLTAEPEFNPLLLKIGRIGRSIGVHLLLASQRIEAGMLRGLDTYLSYWIGMRTFSEAESRAVLDTTDAFTLPAAPGYGYLKVDTSVYTRFRSGYVSGTVSEDTEQPDITDTEQPDIVRVFPLFDTPTQADATTTEEQIAPPSVGRLLVDEVVTRLTTSEHAPPVWLPPLPPRVPLGRVLPADIGTDSQHGLTTVIGVLDDPTHQRQNPWLLDLTIGGGHVALIGAPHTGRSTFLRTVAVSLALTHTPKQVSIYGIDSSGGGLERIEGFPHVGGVATRSDQTRLARLFEELHAMIAQRETLFRERRIDSIASLRIACARGDIPELVAPDVVILVDGVEPIRNEFTELEAPFTALLQRGGTFGIHLVMALTRWNELRTTTQPLVGQRFETRLNDPSESTIQRAASQTLTTAGPGRVLTQDLLYAQIALPTLDEIGDDSAIGDTIAALADRSRLAWSGPSATPIRLLPDILDPAELPDELDTPDTIPFGLRQDTFEAICFDPDIENHLLVFGDTRCGKTTLLRGLAREFIRRYTPDELVFAIIDPRRSLANEIPDDYLGGQATAAKEARGLCEAIATEVSKRHTDTTSAYPRVVVLVDDYDIIATGGTQPLDPLLASLPSARDLSLSVILTRPVAGVGRAMFDPALQAIRDTGGSGLIMDGERSEGAVFPKVYAEQFQPGRGKYVRRGHTPRLIQVANFSPKDT